MLKSRTALAMTALALALAAPAAARADTYVVQLQDAPLATYAGGTDGIPGTSPRATHRKLKADSAPGLDYRAYLARRQAAVLGRVSGAAPRVLYAYRYALSGFAADMTPAQAAQLARQADVVSVEPAEDEHIMDDPDALLGGAFGEPAAYLGLTRDLDDHTAGLWSRLGGPAAANGAGAGMIVADIDTGIEPGHPSFADDGQGYVGAAYAAPAAWNGTCQAGPGFAATDCNHKLIGARYYVDGFGQANLAAGSFVSPRDDDGHGTHTASTAAGNYGVHAQIDGNDFGVPAISGIAPRAYVAAYKVCWNGNGTTAQTGCNSADIVKAIDQAVADGADVINMSIGSNTSQLFGPQEASLLNAAAAGVFVANSAGNAGPNAGTVGAPSDVPWTTSVAASSLARSFSANVTLSNGVTATGSSVTGGAGPAPVVDGGACLTPPAGATGAIVLCARDGNARIAKSQQVLAAGGVGMILTNATAAQELDTDSHYVPTVQVTAADAARIRAALGSGVTATLSPGHVQTGTPPRVLAAFSSRGPQTAVPDIAKPDLSAPGVQILAGAATAPAPASLNRPGQQFAVMQGTSMAAPMVAGTGALLRQLNPALTPAEIKSELMTTAKPVLKEDGATPATPFDGGSGEIDPDRAANAGLVLNATLDDYIHYLEFEDPTIVAGDQPKTRPVDLNLPSIAFSRLVGRDATTRTFTSVDAGPTHWTAAVQGLTGFSAALTGGDFTVAPGQSQAVGLTLTRTSAPFGAWGFGALVLTAADGRTVRLPISVKPVWGAVTTPVAIGTDQSSGAAPLSLQVGWTGPLTETAWGLAAPQPLAQGRRITATTRKVDLSGNDPGTQLYPVTVPAGSQLLSARISNADAGADLDLFLYRVVGGTATLVASSQRTDANEQVNVTFPTAGSYVVAVLGFTTPGSGGSAYDLTDWVLNDPAPNDLSGGGPGLALPGDPLPVSAGDQPTRRLSWSGVVTHGLYLGLVSYAGPEAAPPGFGTVSVVELTKTADGTTPVTGGVGGSVTATLALSLGPAPSFGAFTPGVMKDYAAAGTANVVSTAGSAALSVSDPDPAAPGHLVNGSFALPSALRVAASSPGGTAAPTVTVGGAPAALETWRAPVSNDPVTLAFTQHIGASDALRTGAYGKTLTFTLSTDTP